MEHIYIKKDSLRETFIILLLSVTFTVLFIWMAKEEYYSNKITVIKDFIIPIYIKKFTIALIGLILSASSTIAIIYFRFIKKNEEYYNTPHITIDQAGLKIRDIRKLVRWEDVESITLCNITVKNSTSKSIGIFLKDPYAFHSDQNKYFKFLDIGINNHFNFASLSIQDLNFVKDDKKITLEEILELIYKHMPTKN